MIVSLEKRIAWFKRFSNDQLRAEYAELINDVREQYLVAAQTEDAVARELRETGADMPTKRWWGESRDAAIKEIEENKRAIRQILLHLTR